MTKIISKRRIYDFVICLALLLAVMALVMFPEESVEAGRDGVALCLDVIIPSLFPFFVISALVVELGIAAKLGRIIEPVMSKLFNVGGVCSAAFILGFIGGYPVGAKTAIALYEKGECSKAEAERLLSFCNNSGPAFILGVVGAGVFSSSKVGLILYLAHTAASVIIGLLFRNWGRGRDRGRLAAHRTKAAAERIRFTPAFTLSVKNSAASMLNICGFVVFFTVFIRLLFLTGAIPLTAQLLSRGLSIFGLSAENAEKLITGIIEISSGVWTLQEAASRLSSSVAMAAFMLGWAGLSVHCQALSFLCDSGLSAKTYIMGKFLHGILSAVIVFLIFRLFPFSAPAAAYLAEQVSGIAGLGFTKAILLSTGCSVLIMVFLVMLSLAIPAKDSGKRKRNKV